MAGSALIPELQKLGTTSTKFRDLVNDTRFHHALFQNKEKFNRTCAAMDVIDDVLFALDSYKNNQHDDQGIAYLEIYGVLQALSIQQDAVRELHKIVMGRPVDLESVYPDVQAIRDIRVAELAGLVERSTSDRVRSLKGANCSRIASRARQLREHLYAILAAAHSGRTLPKASLDAIASEVRRAHAARVLVATATSSTVRHGWLLPSSPEIPLYACALAIETLLVTSDHSLIRKCGASDCEVYFMDTSKAHRRQWCSMQNCGNREKQRRWRSGAD